MKVNALIVLLLLMLAMPTVAAPSASDADVVHVLNRLGYGPRPGDAERVKRMGLHAWIEEQLHPERISDADVRRRLAGLRSLAMSPLQTLLAYPPNNVVERIQKIRDDAQRERLLAMMPPESQRGKPREVLQELVSAKLIRAVHSPRQLEEVMVDFLYNHLNVFWNKGADRVLVAAYEREVIRPHAFGRFRDLLVASAKHPAMLFYLDNWLSTASHARVRGGRKPGLNENYARELLELHTLGVDGGYTQKDVVEVARCFTGWTIDEPRRGGAFRFRPEIHDDGQKVVLGRVIPAGGGMRDGLRVLEILAAHPGTARFLSTKLCRRFVCDDPPKALVDRVARVYLQTDGDLRAVVRAVATSPELMSEKYRHAKIKTPLELVASSVRAVGGDTTGGLTLTAALNRMGMVPYMCSPPTGYADRAEAWVSSGALLERLSFAVGLMEGRMTGTQVDAAALVAGVPADRPDLAVDRLVSVLLGGECSKETRSTLDKAIREQPDLSPAKLAGLVLGSPEFQRR